MDDLENSPLLRVFNKKEKPFASSRHTSVSKLSRKKKKNPENQKPFQILQPFTVAEQDCSELSSSYSAVCVNGLTVSCCVEDQKKTFRFPSGHRNSSDLHNSIGFAHYEYVDNSNLLDSGKLKSWSSETKSVDNGNSSCKKNVITINLTSGDNSDNSLSDGDDDVNIHTGQLVTNHLTLSGLKSEEFIESSAKPQSKCTSKKQPDTRCLQQNDFNLVIYSHTSENHSSHFNVNQTIGCTSDTSSDGNTEDICKHLQKLEVSDNLPAKNSTCKTPHTPEKNQLKCQTPSTTKKLEVLQSFFSSDDDYSPPPLSKRLLKDKQDAPPFGHREKDVAPADIKKKTSPASKYIRNDVTASSAVYNKKKGVSSWENIRLEDSETSSSAESSDTSESDEEGGSSGSEDFEEFLVQLKTPLKKRLRSPESKRVGNTKNVIKGGKTEQKKITSAASSPPLPKVKVKSRVLSNQPSDICPNYLDTKGKEKTASSNSDDSSDISPSSESGGAKFVSTKKTSSRKASFLASLSADVPDSLADFRALMYRRDFMKKREELVEKLFDLYNDKVFNHKLPKDMKVTWNPNLTKTAGKCFSKRDSSVPLGRVAWIELAPKILDSADRVRDTLVHEMCHAACWLVHGNRGGHGPLWKFWASRVQQVFPDIPPVTTCHRYKINTKYVYVCTGCGGKIGRHSKSIDVTKNVCSRCRSKFELVVNGKTANTSSKPTTGFALFVKENYGNLKRQHAGVKHGDIMKMLSAEFALKTKISV